MRRVFNRKFLRIIKKPAVFFLIAAFSCFIIFPILNSNVIKAETWTQTTQSDFNNGIKNNVDTFSDPGNVTLSYTWQKYSGNPIMEIGSPGSWNDQGTAFPTVTKDGSTYKMWFAGSGNSPNWEIGYAESTDGIVWTENPLNPIFTKGSIGSWEGLGVTFPTVLKEGPTYKMWYTGYLSREKIGYAESLDGISWTKEPTNPVLDVGSPGSWDDLYASIPAVIKNGSEYRMWYRGFDSADYRIGHAASPDGIFWTKHSQNPIMDIGPPGSWEEIHVSAPTVKRFKNIFDMWYVGGDGASFRLGHAISNDGLNWTRNPSNPVLDLGPPGSWDDSIITICDIFKNDSSYTMWYSGHDGSVYRIGAAKSNYSSIGTLESAIFDSGVKGTSWNSINWKEYLPPITNITFATRTGDTPNPDASWSSWSSEMWIESSSSISSHAGRYFQYRATLTTGNNSVTPVLSEVNVNYTLGDDNPPTITNLFASPNPQIAGNSVLISARISDDITAEEDLIVYIDITSPNGTLFGNFTAVFNQSANRHEFESEFNMVGTYNFTFWASDEEGNWAHGDGQFNIESPEKEEYNWKPLIAVIFSIILLVAGLLASYFRPVRFKGTLGRDRFMTFFLIPFPFIIAELITGIVSFFTGLLTIPPLLDVGMIVDLIVLVAGIIGIMVILVKGKNPAAYEMKDNPLQPPPPPLPPPP
jgi:hypothetical protein